MGRAIARRGITGGHEVEILDRVSARSSSTSPTRSTHRRQQPHNLNHGSTIKLLP
jgi:hypothetical protein